MDADTVGRDGGERGICPPHPPDFVEKAQYLKLKMEI
jgi:hypothetical protein